MDENTKSPAWVEAWAEQMDALNLSPLALLFIDVLRPFRVLGSQALLLAMPLMAGITDSTTPDRLLNLLDEPEMLCRLEECLRREENEV